MTVSAPRAVRTAKIGPGAYAPRPELPARRFVGEGACWTTFAHSATAAREFTPVSIPDTLGLVSEGGPSTSNEAGPGTTPPSIASDERHLQ